MELAELDPYASHRAVQPGHREPGNAFGADRDGYDTAAWQRYRDVPAGCRASGRFAAGRSPDGRGDQGDLLGVTARERFRGARPRVGYGYRRGVPVDSGARDSRIELNPRIQNACQDLGDYKHRAIMDLLDIRSIALEVGEQRFDRGADGAEV